MKKNKKEGSHFFFFFLNFKCSKLNGKHSKFSIGLSLMQWLLWLAAAAVDCYRLLLLAADCCCSCSRLQIFYFFFTPVDLAFGVM